MNKLQMRRKEKGLSQSQLADASGVNVRMIQYYEQGAKDIMKAQVETVYKLAHTLGCLIEDII